MRKLWGGAFGEDQDALVVRFGQSIESDLAFWQEDLIGSVAHARMLGATGIISEQEAATLIAGLERMHEEGPGSLPADVEDVHTAVELRLAEIVGEVAGKLHTARSRNDQVATDSRLFVHNQLHVVHDLIKKLQAVLLELADRYKSDLMPGYTHQQRAQPLTLGFHLLAHFWALQRHGWRAQRIDELANVSPLGAAALGGTSFPIDRHMTASELGFDAPIPNALDAVSDRGYILDALHLCTDAMVSLSRLAQELILWSTREFGFVSLSDQVTTGSSIMPQKRNPDMAELIRGRAAGALANYVSLAAAMRALPLGYNRDTQDDKPPLFESLRLLEDSLALCAAMLQSATWHTGRMREAIAGDFSTATDLADYLASRGVPFRRAHEAVGKLVRECVALGCGLESLSAEQLASIAPDIPADALEVLSPESSVRRRESFGGPGPVAMEAQLARADELHGERGFARFV